MGHISHNHTKNSTTLSSLSKKWKSPRTPLGCRLGYVRPKLMLNRSKGGSVAVAVHPHQMLFQTPIMLYIPIAFWIKMPRFKELVKFNKSISPSPFTQESMKYSLYCEPLNKQHQNKNCNKFNKSTNSSPFYSRVYKQQSCLFLGR